MAPSDCPRALDSCSTVPQSVAAGMALADVSFSLEAWPQALSAYEQVVQVAPDGTPVRSFRVTDPEAPDRLYAFFAGSDDHIRKLAPTRLPNHQTVYAMTIHKSQGSEYPAVVIPILTQHYVLLQRNLIYTAVTRGRRLVVLIGTRKALAIGIKNNKTRLRFTGLQHRLQAS